MNGSPTTTSSRWDAVRYRSGALYFGTQTFSTIGTFMQAFAQSWLVLQLTGDRTSLPISISLSTLPLLLFGTYGGAIADRFDNRTLLLITSAVNAVLAVALGVLVQIDRVNVGLVYAFSLMTGFVAVVERPATQAFLSELVAPTSIQSAVGLNSMIFPMARLAGPPIASLSIAVAGIAWCFYLNTATYVVFAIGLLMLRRSEMYPRRIMASRKGMTMAGLRYARADPVVGQLLLVTFFVGFAGYNFMAAVPMMGKYTFHLSDSGLVPTLAVSAVGALVAGLLAASLKAATVRRQGVAAMIFGLTLALYGMPPTPFWWAVLSLPVGIASTMFQVVTATALQRAARPDMLGRVMALNSIGLLGTTPLGMIFVALLSNASGTRSPFIVGGLVVALCGLVSIRQRRVRQQLPATPA